MRGTIFAFTIITLATSSQAQTRASGRLGSTDIARLPRIAPAVTAGIVRDYRVMASPHADRSAHRRALDEMNLINNRRPSAFRFRPVMALTVDAADLDGPARMTGIAPVLMGIDRPR